MTIADAARMTGLSTILAECVDDYYRTEVESIDQITKRIRIAVLESVREPSERMVTAGYGHSDPADTWCAMIDTLITEVREAGNDA